MSSLKLSSKQAECLIEVVKPRELQPRRYIDIVYDVFLVWGSLILYKSLIFFRAKLMYSIKEDIALTLKKTKTGKSKYEKQYCLAYFLKPDLGVGHSSACMAHSLRGLQDEDFHYGGRWHERRVYFSHNCGLQGGVDEVKGTKTVCKLLIKTKSQGGESQVGFGVSHVMGKLT